MLERALVGLFVVYVVACLVSLGLAMFGVFP